MEVQLNATAQFIPSVHGPQQKKPLNLNRIALVSETRILETKRLEHLKMLGRSQHDSPNMIVMVNTSLYCKPAGLNSTAQIQQQLDAERRASTCFGGCPHKRMEQRLT